MRLCYKIKPRPISGEVTPPPSKSHTMRGLIFALMGQGESIIRHPLFSPDTERMIEAIRGFGARVKVYPDSIAVQGVGGVLQTPNGVIESGNSGLVFRFITAIASLIDNYVIITGDESIRARRPILPLLSVFKKQGLFAESLLMNGRAPIMIKGPLRSGVMHIEGEDSQPVSALLIASSFLSGASEIIVTNPGEKPWIDLALDWISRLGGKIERGGYTHYKVSGGLQYEGFDTTIPKDFSGASYPLAAALITGQTMKVSGLNIDDLQADKYFIELLQKMGAKIFVENGEIFLEKTFSFKGIEASIDHCIDTLPLLAAIAPFGASSTRITHAKMARYKESDRIASITEELRKMGASIEEEEGGMIIHPSRLKGGLLQSHQDHRIALSLVVAASAAQGESVLEGVEVIAKSYPLFIEEFISLGGVCEKLDLDRNAWSWKDNSWESAESKDRIYSH